jgi:hypothetical protein
MEERVRDAFGAAAETITALDLPPRPDPARKSGAARTRPAWVLPAWAVGFRGRALFPVAAAAAVTAIAVAAAVVTPGLLSGSPGGAPAQTAGGLSGAPPFFAGIVSEASGHPHLGKRIGKTNLRRCRGCTFVNVVKIFSSATGMPAGAIKSPASQIFESLSRLGDDQTFVAASYDRSACVTHLWKFTIDAAGKPSALTPLSVPQLSGSPEELTSSADGKVLAFSLSGCQPNDLQIGVIHLTTGQVTHWHNPGIGASVSLTADGSMLGFAFGPLQGDSPYQAWTVPADAPAGDLLSLAHQVPGLGANAERAVLSPSGEQLYVEAQSQPKGPVTLSLLTTSTGALVRQVAQLSPGGKDLNFPALALDAAGQHLLSYGYGGVEAIDLSSGQHLSLPVTHPVVEGALTTFAW